MKKLTATLAVCLSFGLGLVGCSSGNGQPTPAASEPTASSPAAQPTLAQEGTLLVDTDPNAQVVDGAGVKVSIDQTAKTATLQLIDPQSGQDFANYYVFDYGARTMLSHRLVEVMQKEYDYTLDLGTGELVVIVDAEGKDAMGPLKEMGRFDKAQTDRAQERTDLEAWFQGRYGKTLEEAVLA
ncbi:MAG: hypothetical protein Q4D79_04940 [Propionibacteriaceae bacterium]|nr:hypothetical protein [Propionibacteriaceae bacterium]